MKYLKKYNEPNDNIYIEISNTIDDICIDLKDMDFKINNNFTFIETTKKIEISRERDGYLFGVKDNKYELIEEMSNTIIRLRNYLRTVGFRVRNVTYSTMLDNGTPMDINNFIHFIKGSDNRIPSIRKIIITIDKI